MQAATVQSQLQFAREYTLSADDINRIVRDRKAKGLVKKPLNSQRAELILERQAAEERGDEEALLRCAHMSCNGSIYIDQHTPIGPLTPRLHTCNKGSSRFLVSLVILTQFVMTLYHSSLVVLPVHQCFDSVAEMWLFCLTACSTQVESC